MFAGLFLMAFCRSEKLDDGSIRPSPIKRIWQQYTQKHGSTALQNAPAPHPSCFDERQWYGHPTPGSFTLDSSVKLSGAKAGEHTKASSHPTPDKRPRYGHTMNV